ncbi:hypothetical protein [Lactobacillus delbrueckii]|uniref:hypothetical protein n=1 Tax=Lactobacillus delbrueckii TaxID=1584 RepID=UPI001E28B6E8|nr:hypothetical protein [Lactobacillus delbrueckii]MCD5487049.1 hypothetical protein [Lactobacillus delbrueckii subsp. lactis]
MTTRNEEIKAAIKAAGVYHYEVAEVLGISENYLSSLLHRRLSDHQKKSIVDAIQTARINRATEEEEEEQGL